MTTWVLEYSQEAQRRGLYPLHATTQDRSQRSGAGALGWEVIATGTAEEITAALEAKAAELGISETESGR